MVAAHAWDLAGAKHVGLQTAFVVRPGKTLYPNVARPDYVVNDLLELEKVLQTCLNADYKKRAEPADVIETVKAALDSSHLIVSSGK